MKIYNVNIEIIILKWIMSKDLLDPKVDFVFVRQEVVLGAV